MANLTNTEASGPSSEPGMKGRLAKGTAYIAGAKFLGLSMGLISTIVLARYLLPSDFGLVAIATALVMIFARVSELSLSQALIQIDNPKPHHFDTAWTLSLIRSFLLGGIVAAVAFPVSQIYGDARLINILLVLAFSSLIGGVSNPKMIIFLRNLDFKQAAYVSLVEKFSGFITGITIAIVFRSYWALVAGVVISQLTRTLLTYVMIRYRPRWSLKGLSDLFGFSVWMSLGSWVQALGQRSDTLILGYFLSISQLGQLTLSKRIVYMASHELISPLLQILFPAFSRVNKDPVRLRTVYLKAIATITSLAFPIAAGLAVVAEPLINLALGEKWMPVVPIMQILCVIAVINAMQFVQPVAMAVGNTKSLFGRDVRVLLIRLPLMFLGIFVGHKIGIGYLYGALFGSVFAAIINALWNMQLLSQISSIKFLDQIGGIIRPLIATLIMITGVLLFQNFESYQGWNWLLQTLSSVSVGISAYCISLTAIWYLTGRPEGLETLIIGGAKHAVNIYRAS